MFDFRNVPMVAFIPFMYHVLAQLTESILVDDEVIKLMHSKEKYDVCVFEVFNIDALLVIIGQVISIILKIMFVVMIASECVCDMNS